MSSPWASYAEDALAQGLHNWCKGRSWIRCLSIYPPSVDAPHEGSGWSGPLRCTLSEGHGQIIAPNRPAIHWNTGIHWTDQ